MVARLGGDEFAVLVTGEVGALTNLAAGLLNALTQPAVAGCVSARASGGAVGRPSDTTDTLLHRADQAMYRAKAQGGGRFLLEGDRSA